MCLIKVIAFSSATFWNYITMPQSGQLYTCLWKSILVCNLLDIRNIDKNAVTYCFIYDVVLID